MFSVMGTEKMKVVVSVPDQYARFLDEGDPVVVWTNGYADSTYRGAIAQTAFAEDPATNTLRAEIDLDNKDGRLRPGQAWMVSIVLDDRKQVLSIPVTALNLNMGGEAECDRVVNGRAVRTRIKHGELNGKRVEVLAGLHEGDIVVANFGSVSDGQLIKAGRRPRRKAIEVDLARDTPSAGSSIVRVTCIAWLDRPTHACYSLSWNLASMSSVRLTRASSASGPLASTSMAVPHSAASIVNSIMLFPQASLPFQKTRTSD